MDKLNFGNIVLLKFPLQTQRLLRKDQHSSLMTSMMEILLFAGLQAKSTKLHLI